MPIEIRQKESPWEIWPKLVVVTHSKKDAYFTFEVVHDNLKLWAAHVHEGCVQNAYHVLRTYKGTHGGRSCYIEHPLQGWLHVRWHHPREVSVNPYYHSWREIEAAKNISPTSLKVWFVQKRTR